MVFNSTKRKIKWLEKHGFVEDVNVSQDVRIKVWENKNSGKRIPNAFIEVMTYRELVKDMKNKNSPFYASQNLQDPSQT